MLILIEFERIFVEMSDQLLKENQFDIDFKGQMMVRFEKREGKCIAVNGINGYGDNIASEIGGKEAFLYKQIDWI